mmetsp:Transcript_3321/g.5603  ORF Transcript_3321/g.5603 Transcript_3321/m.5603 type:complete len:397 (-) Transcript_3321:246-1436(-)
MPQHNGDGGQEPKHVVIVGGGYCGTAMARRLASQSGCKVTLVDPRAEAWHKMAGLRAAVQPEWYSIAQIPRNMPKGSKLCVASVKSVSCGDPVESPPIGQAAGEGTKGPTPLHVELEDGRVLNCDVVVAATGSRNASIGECPMAGPVLDYLVNRVVIVGGGSVGCELAGEVCAARPEARVYLVQSTNELCGGGKAGKLMEQQLRRLGVHVLLNKRVHVEKLQHEQAGYHGTMFVGAQEVELDTGRKLWADVVLTSVGSKPNSEPFPTSWLDDAGFITVNKYLQSNVQENVFVVGDVAALNEEKLLQYGLRHVNVALKNIKRYLRGKKPKYMYKTRPLLGVVISVGPKHGVTTTAIPSLIFGSFVSAQMKSKALLSPFAYDLFGTRMPKLPKASKTG